ncbi:uncharacterized protein LOC107270110 isoform X2 [Cephus cinctus]|nr:uncharacterized protein LOC107270110 isoform X2 [Cephus cinctus]XP_015600295.1 uncharacterized protein LOC107270110 isoform X2 [Cephus cinctus]XP_015600296.1 uncharacterized protein LOC107270110 isoform X2 [Cephus cinctus]XP_015600297.1 uncharacterized protein LOC107270110 isoform X2 [Cephus cinctus]
MNPWEILASIAILVSIVSGEEAKWIWGEGAKKKSDTIEKNARYQVYEYPSNGNLNAGVRPQYSGPYGSDSGPILPVNHGTQILVGPEGPTGIVGRPGINNGGIVSGPIKPGFNVDPITVGSVPSWIKQDHRYREYDSCKCSYGFNCPGLKFGSCAKGKQYCCYDSRKLHGLAPAHANYSPHGAYQGLPFKPFNAIPSNYYASRPQNNYENGRPIPNHYNGPYSPDYDPYDHNDSYESYERPHIASHYDRPGYYNHGRPYATRPYDISGYARSNGSEKTNEESKGRSVTSNDEVSSTSTQSGSSASPSA